MIEMKYPKELVLPLLSDFFTWVQENNACVSFKTVDYGDGCILTFVRVIVYLSQYKRFWECKEKLASDLSLLDSLCFLWENIKFAWPPEPGSSN